MKTMKWLEKQCPCYDGLDWFMANRHRCKTDVEIIELLIKEDHLDWANWGITRILNRKQRILYAVYAAKQALPIFEDRYPNDKRPHKTIEAAEAVLKSNTKRNRDAAAEAVFYAKHASDEAEWDTAYAASEADDKAFYAASEASYAAACAAEAAKSAEAAEAAAEAAAARRDKPDKATFRKILKYGINLLSAAKEIKNL